MARRALPSGRGLPRQEQLMQSIERDDSPSPERDLTPGRDSTPVIIDTNKKFPFMKLAPETRNAIYKIANTTEEYIGKKANTYKEFRSHAASVRNLAFAMTCRQVYEESSSVFFGYNGFSFEDPEILLRFLQSIGIKNRERLRKLAYIHSYGFKWIENRHGDLVKSRKRLSPYAFPALRYLRSCVRLEELDIYLMIELNDHFAEVVRLEDAKKLFLSASTVVQWAGPRMLVTSGGSARDITPAFMKVAPPDLEKAGIVKNRCGVKFIYFSEEGTEAFGEIFREERARLDGQEKFTQNIRQVKTDAETPQLTGGSVSPRFIRKLPDVFDNSKRKTQLYCTNFKTAQERYIARLLHSLMSLDALNMPPMDTEYGDLIGVIDEEEEEEAVAQTPKAAGKARHKKDSQAEVEEEEYEEPESESDSDDDAQSCYSPDPEASDPDSDSDSDGEHHWRLPTKASKYNRSLKGNKPPRHPPPPSKTKGKKKAVVKKSVVNPHAAGPIPGFSTTLHSLHTQARYKGSRKGKPRLDGQMGRITYSESSDECSSDCVRCLEDTISEYEPSDDEDDEDYKD